MPFLPHKVTTVATIYSYDGENRLVKIESPGKVVEYKYDPLGRRIEKNVNGVIIRYLYDGPNVVLEYHAKGGVKSSYLHGPRIDEPLALERGKQVYNYHAAGLGSVTELTNSSGVMVKSYQYKGFGQIYSQSGSLSQPFTFTGREHDPESGLYYYRARYYNPRAGRFLPEMIQIYKGTPVKKILLFKEELWHIFDLSKTKAEALMKRDALVQEHWWRDSWPLQKCMDFLLSLKFDFMLTYLEDPPVPRCGHSETLVNVWRQIEKVRRGFKTHQGLFDHLKLFQLTHYLKKPI